MTSPICARTSEGVENQLKDTRDGQLYYVGKMKDGKCWMLQNLALGSTSSATTLTSANSNVMSSWSLPQSYTSATSGDRTATAIQSWNFGKVVLATPLLTEGCGGQSSVSGCTRYGFVDVSDEAKFQPTYTAETGTWNGATVTSNTLIAVSCSKWSGSGSSKKCTAGTYDPHYLVGSYYSWNAATAGTGVGLTSGQAGGSICPKGWKLPTSNSTAVGSFAELLNQYGVDSSVSGSVDGATYNIAEIPLRFIRGGNVWPGVYVQYAGQEGDYWLSTPASSSDYAYHLSFRDSSVYPSVSSARYYGFSVRCIAQ